MFKTQSTINCQGQLVDLSQPKVMGIVNITPDSFYAGSRAISSNAILQRVDDMVKSGVDFIDIGAYSSRPGAEHITEKEEWERLIPALNDIRTSYPDILLSVDTFRSKIAAKCIEQFGVNIINDISGGDSDSDMYSVVGQFQVPYILMHIKGTPQNMQANPEYSHIVQEMLTYFSFKVEKLLKSGATDIIIDPGFGFGKTLNHNYELLARLHEFKMLEKPLLVGVSRKSMIYNYLDIKAEDALNGTTAINMHALMHGAAILRVHDVSEAVETVKLFSKIKESVN